jgi:hypothetical protein
VKAHTGGLRAVKIESFDNLFNVAPQLVPRTVNQENSIGSEETR